MFHFTGYRVLFPTFPFASPCGVAGFGKRRWPVTATRLPHSEISGSKCICHSPKLIAAYHVLHRLLAPRHPLCALKSLIPCLKSATRTCLLSRTVSTLCGSCDPPATGSSIAVGYRLFCRKNDVFGNQNIFKDRKNSSQGSRPARGLLHFAISCSQSNHISLHMDVKERTDVSFISCGTKPARRAENGGPDRTRTYDPRLIKAVL